MNVEQVISNASLETLLAIFFNTSVHEDGFMVESRYRKATSRYADNIPFDDSTYFDTARRLTNKYHLEFSRLDSMAVGAFIVNDRHLSLDDFLNQVYVAILPKISELSGSFDLDVEIATALFTLRGSVDFNRCLYAVDVKNATPRYIDNLFKILLSSDELLSRLNLNFRELQPQFVAGTNLRNTQIRINLKWYYDKVILRNNLNEYKTEILRRNLPLLGDVRKFNGFEDRLVVYRQSILGRNLTEHEIDELRAELEFTSRELEKNPENTFDIRNQKIVSYARETFEDVCVGCGHKYSTEDRTFLMPRNNRFYSEINHVIAYANDSKVVDVVDNLVKLCPTCHRALTPGRAFPELQKEIIQHELESRPEVKRFVLSMMDDRASGDGALSGGGLSSDGLSSDDALSRDAASSDGALSPVDFVFSMLK